MGTEASGGDCLIQGGSVIDGTGLPAVPADLRVRAGRIVEIGQRLLADGERRIDATGCVVTPGFIDTHTHYDASIFWDPRCDPIALHGVTSLLIGNCALGLAPVRPAERAELGALFSFVEDIPPSVFETQVPWRWESWPDYAAYLKSMPLGVNVAALVSHSLLRQYAMGADAWQRAATPAETAAMASLAGEAMAAGAFGLSVSRFDRSPDGRLVPSYHADDAELAALCAAIAPARGVVQIIPTQNDADAWHEDLRRLCRIASLSGCPVVSNFIGQRPDDPTAAPRLLELARELRAGGADFFHMASPRSIDLVLNFQQSMLLMYVPAWNAVLQSTMPESEKKAALADPAWRAAAREQWDAVPFPRDVAALFRIIEVGTAANEPWLGRSFGDLLAARPGHASDCLADWALENDLLAKFTYPYTNTDAAIVGSLLAAPENLISGSDAGAHIAMFDGAGDTTLVLTRHVRDRGDLTLEQAVHRMTAEPARFLGLSDRGRISVGAVADLAIFRLEDLAWRDCVRVRDVPGKLGRLRRPAGGYRFTLIAGQVVQQEGEATSALPARFLAAGDRA